MKFHEEFSAHVELSGNRLSPDKIIPSKDTI